MSDINWTKLKANYIKSDISQEALAKKHKVVYKTVQQRAQRENWMEARKEYKRKIGEKIVEKSADIIANQIVLLKEKERKEIELINQAILNSLVKDGKLNSELTAADINSLSRARKNVQDMFYKSYGIADKQEIDINSPLPLTVIINDAGTGKK